MTLNAQQKKMIKTALQYVYDKKLDAIKENRKIMSESEIKKSLELANKYYDLQDLFD